MTVVVLRALGLGDLLTSVPALRGLRAAFPGDTITLATTAPMATLARWLPGVDHVVEVGELQPLPVALACPDVAVNLHGSGPQSHELLTALRPGRLIAFRHPDVPASHAAPDWRPDEHEVVRWCRLLDAHDVPADPRKLEIAVPAGDVPPQAVGATVIHPGAKAVARRWPWQRFAAVARHEHARGRSVVVTGSPDERDLATAVAEHAGVPADAVLAGTTDVVGLVRVIAAADRVVCGDTGVGHVATATATPSVVLFGPTSPATWGPPADRPWHRALWVGRHGDPLGDEPFEGLLAIGVDEVLDALDDLPEPGRAPAVAHRPVEDAGATVSTMSVPRRRGDGV